MVKNHADDTGIFTRHKVQGNLKTRSTRMFITIIALNKHADDTAIFSLESLTRQPEEFNNNA